MAAIDEREGALIGFARDLSRLASFTQERPLLAVSLAAGFGFATGARWLGKRPFNLAYKVASIGLVLRSR